MKKTILLWSLGLLPLLGCRNSPSVTGTQVQAISTAKPVSTSTNVRKHTFIKLDPKFRFVIKTFGFGRDTDSKTRREAISFRLLLGFQGPKPTWWGKGGYDLFTVTCVTENGQKFIGAGSRENSEDFYEEDNPGQYRTVAYVVVPGLKKSMRVTRIEVVHNIADAGLARVTIPIPANKQLNQRPIIVLGPGPKPTSTPVSSAPRQLTVFLPGEDGKLHETKLKEPSDLAKKPLWEPESALTLLFLKAPQFFPANTRLTESISKNKEYGREHPSSDIYVVFEVKLSKEFSNSPLWHNKEKARLAFEAIIETASRGISNSIHPTYPFHIYVLVNGKPVTKLGRIKVENPA